jgi:hypothetical protein
LAKHKALKTQRFHFRTAGKKAILREIFPCALLCTEKNLKKMMRPIRPLAASGLDCLLLIIKIAVFPG